MMENNLILTQTKEVIMTLEKTVTLKTERLETIDSFGRKRLIRSGESQNVDFHNGNTDIRRAA